MMMMMMVVMMMTGWRALRRLLERPRCNDSSRRRRRRATSGARSARCESSAALTLFVLAVLLSSIWPVSFLPSESCSTRAPSFDGCQCAVCFFFVLVRCSFIHLMLFLAAIHQWDSERLLRRRQVAANQVAAGADGTRPLRDRAPAALVDSRNGTGRIHGLINWLVECRSYPWIFSAVPGVDALNHRHVVIVAGYSLGST